ncbi:MAG: hypothetical protein ACLQVD_04475 [Capsulimonadaceae bacterium]
MRIDRLLLMRLSRGAGAARIYIPEGSLPITANELIDRINAHRAAIAHDPSVEYRVTLAGFCERSLCLAPFAVS